MVHHPSFGAVLKWDPAGGTVYVAIGQVRDITGPNISRGEIDVTDHDDAASGKYRQFLPGVPDPGDVTFTIGWDPNTTPHQQGVGTGLIGDFEQTGCTLPAFQLQPKTCTGTAIWTADGFLTGFSPSYAVEGDLVADVSIKVSGKPTLTVT